MMKSVLIATALVLAGASAHASLFSPVRRIDSSVKSFQCAQNNARAGALAAAYDGTTQVVTVTTSAGVTVYQVTLLAPGLNGTYNLNGYSKEAGSLQMAVYPVGTSMINQSNRVVNYLSCTVEK
jgi:hypothetical protein